MLHVYFLFSITTTLAVRKRGAAKLGFDGIKRFLMEHLHGVFSDSWALPTRCYLRAEDNFVGSGLCAIPTGYGSPKHNGPTTISMSFVFNKGMCTLHMINV